MRVKVRIKVTTADGTVVAKDSVATDVVDAASLTALADSSKGVIDGIAGRFRSRF